MSTASIDRLTRLAPKRTIENHDLANSPAEFGVCKVKLGLYSDYLIAVKHEFHGEALLGLLKKLAFIHWGIDDDIPGVKADLDMPTRASEERPTPKGREPYNARLKRIHEIDPTIHKAFNEFRADSLQRWNRALAIENIYQKRNSIDSPPANAEPIRGLIAWRKSSMTGRRFLGRVEAFEAAAQIGIWVGDQDDLFLGRSMAGLWSDAVTRRWPKDLRLREGEHKQSRMALQGALLASVEHYNRALFTEKNGLFQTLEAQIDRRLTL